MIKINLQQSIWVIGDVHGEYEMLLRLLDKLPKNAIICFVGDLVDRGYASKSVIKLIKEKKYYVVKGNHEEIMIKAYNENENNFHNWIKNGGAQTIESYFNIPREVYEKGLFQNKEFKDSVRSNKKIKKDVKWLSKLPTIIKFEIKGEKPLYVSHSGLDLYKTDKEIEDNNSDNYVMSNRVKHKEVDYALNIHGHTITYEEQSVISKSEINIDTGGFSTRMFLGKLTAIEYPSLRKVFSNDRN